jgi:hypothetical protein
VDNSVGQVTYNIKQSVAFGFETDFTVQFLHFSKTCESIVCIERYQEGFAFIIQNESPKIETILPLSSYGEGLGYQGLASGLVVEFDFNQSQSLDDPTYPHISVQYRSDGNISAHHSYSLAYTRLDP